MKKRLLTLALISVCTLFAVAAEPTFAAGEEAQEPPAPYQITPETLESKIAQVEADTSIEDDAKTKLLEQFREALSELQKAAQHNGAALTYRQAAQTAPLRTQRLREELEKTQASAPQSVSEIERAAPLDEIEQMLQKEKADLAALSARRADVEKELAAEKESRPAVLRQRLAEAKNQQEKVASQLELPRAADEGRVTAEAREWLLQARARALSSEIEMLDQELQSQPVRLDLLQAEWDLTVANAERLSERIKTLEDLVTTKRQAEADLAKADAEAIRRDAEGKHPLVVSLAEQDAALSAEIAGMASRLDDHAEQAALADKFAGQIEDDFRSASETIEIGGLSQELGHMLQQQRQSLPDLRALRHQVKEREEAAAEIGVRRLRYRQEQKRLRDLDAYVAGVIAQAGAEETPMLRGQLRELAAERKTLIEGAIESSDFHLRRLAELETAQGRLIEAIRTYDDFLNEKLLWIRSASRAQLEELGALPEQVWRILSPTGWLGVAAVLAYQATHSPAFVLLALALGLLLWHRRHLIALIVATGTKLGKPTTDRFGYSLQALGLTLVAASTWPLLMAVTGWQLKVSPQSTDFSNAVGSSLLAVAALFFYLRALYLICIPDGLAAAHFRWLESDLDLLRRELTRLGWIYVPAAMVTIVAFNLDPLNVGWAIGRSAFLIMALALALGFFRMLHPRTGVLANYMHRPEGQMFRRLHRIWYPMLVATPLALGLLSLMGYLYTAGVLLSLVIETAWLVVGLTIIAALARRWLLITRRRLAYDAAMERRQQALQAEAAQDQAQAADAPEATEVEEPQADLVALSDTSRKLSDTAVVIAGLVGLWMIWSEVLPALRILDDLTLWHHTVTIEGQDQVEPVTLADMSLAFLYAVGTVILAKQLPAVLEMIMLKRADMSSGTRYTVTTLTTYAIVAIGILLVLNTIGAQWSKLQWLVAALGVGIGFGLQEIVANFISGIIILAERPVRVGDIVSVGDTDGVVTRIRIRATSIRNWDRQELLVPNKELVTGKVLNWSLTDKMTRVVVVVGVAYGTDVDKALNLMRDAADEHEHVLADPPPLLSFEGFGDNSLTLILRAYLSSVDFRLSTTTELHKAVNRKFEAAGVVIAFPQRDLHLDTAEALRVQIENPREPAARAAGADNPSAPD